GAPRISAATAAPASEGQRILQIRIDEPPISGRFRAGAPRTPWREPRGDYTFVLRNATARAAAATAITAGESPLRALFGAYLRAGAETVLALPTPRLSQLRRAFQTRAWLPWVSQRHIGLLAKSTTCPFPTRQSTTAGRSASSSPLSSIPEIQRSSFFANFMTIRGRRSAGGRRFRTKSRISSGRSLTVSGGVLGGCGGATEGRPCGMAGSVAPPRPAARPS